MVQSCRAVVCSDLHGRPQVFEAILNHADFNQGSDRLIIAGDLGDDRSGDAEVLRMAESLEAEILLGNHELSRIDECDEREGDAFQRELVLDRVIARNWKMAASEGDTLVTHAGVSAQFAGHWSLASLDAAGMAKRLNRLAVAIALRSSKCAALGDEAGLLDPSGPAWFYPSEAQPPFFGVHQVTGHRVPGYQIQWPDVDHLARQGFFHVDPGVRVYEDDTPGRTHIRYALIQDGEIAVVDEFVG